MNWSDFHIYLVWLEEQWPSKDVQVYSPRTCDYVTLHAKKDFADVITLKTLRWGDYFGLSPWAQCNHE